MAEKLRVSPTMVEVDPHVFFVSGNLNISNIIIIIIICDPHFTNVNRQISRHLKHHNIYTYIHTDIYKL